MASAGISSSAASAPAGSSNLASSVASTPPAPVLRRKPQSKGNVGAGKLYADHAAFQADVDAWNLEQAEHKKKMAERKRDLDKQRDRSGRQRGNEQETDSERVVRQRQENAAAADNHAQQQAAQRQKSRLTQQQAWARDVGVFADVCSCAEPYSHPLAYTSHLRSSDEGDKRGVTWLRDAERIGALRDYIAAYPPTGDANWEIDVDNKAYELWGKDAGLSSSIRCGYLMLIQLPSAPKVMVATLRDEALSPTAGSMNEWRAKRGLGPVPGWEASVAAGYMQPPLHQELPANEMEQIERGGTRADEVRHELRSEQQFCERCFCWHNYAVPCDQAHRFPFHRNVTQYLRYMGGEVYVEGRAEPVQGHISVDRYIELINTRDRFGRPDHYPRLCLASSATVSSAVLRAGDFWGTPLCEAHSISLCTPEQLKHLGYR
jgi:hypothetical protein